MADQAGFASLWVLDHFFQMPGAGAVEEPMLESYVTLGFLAAHTQQVDLGVMVTGVVYRHPGILVKSVSALDVLSGGRAVLGIGAAWYEREAEGLGIPFPRLGIRFEMLEETLRIAQQMWSDDNGPFYGKHFQLAETLNSPQPLRQPHPPILIGGMGERKTLRLVARYGDACNFDMGIGEDALAHKLTVLRHHCAETGRDYEAIEKTAVGHVDLGRESADDVIARCRRLRELGFTHVMFNLSNTYQVTPLAEFGERIIPAVADW
jgi:F420-dependent oxidoreductase-like protein